MTCDKCNREQPNRLIEPVNTTSGSMNLCEDCLWEAANLSGIQEQPRTPSAMLSNGFGQLLGDSMVRAIRDKKKLE